MNLEEQVSVHKVTYNPHLDMIEILARHVPKYHADWKTGYGAIMVNSENEDDKVGITIYKLRTFFHTRSARGKGHDLEPGKTYNVSELIEVMLGDLGGYDGIFANSGSVVRNLLLRYRLTQVTILPHPIIDRVSEDA